MATKTRELADFILEEGIGGDADIAIQGKPHIRPGVLQPAVAGKLLNGATHSGAYGTAQTQSGGDGHSYYYTDIKGSKPIKDPRIGAHFGSQRHKFKSLQKLEQETAMMRESTHAYGWGVYSVDGREWIRMVGEITPSYGNHGTPYFPLNATGEYVEIVGYFNDANVILLTASDQDLFSLALNGTDLTANNPGVTVASPIQSRYVDAGSVINISFSTTPTLGINTIKITRNEWLGIYGIDLIVQDTTSTTTKSQIQIPAQTVVSYGKKFTLSASAPHYNPFAFKTDGTTAWASGAHNGTSWPVGTGSSANIDTATSLGLDAWVSTNYYKPYNGGRVVWWIDSSGTLKCAVNMMPPNARSIANSASLTNGTEKGDDSAGTTSAAVANNTFYPTFTDQAVDYSQAEVAKTFHPMEFGNGSANGGTNASSYADASMISSSSDDIAYVMDDGLTSLSGSAMAGYTTGTVGGVSLATHTNTKMYLTFIGTGFSISMYQAGNHAGSDDYKWSLDSIELKRWQSGSNAGGHHVIAQNLPYGTHVFKLDRVTASNQVQQFGECSIHQPKMPPIPEDAVVIADYMLMADFVVVGAEGVDKISKGVRVSMSSRDHFYNANSVAFNIAHEVQHPSGLRIASDQVASGESCSVELPYFGTDFVINTYGDRFGTVTEALNSDVGTSATIGTTDHAACVKHTGNNLALNKMKNIKSNSGYFWHASTEVASPIHTSSHYQTFETPTLHELVGGDRNMEQTNLVVTSDGKTWDQVTRDTSYIGKVVLNAFHNTEYLSASNTQIFDEWRGTHNGFWTLGNKDFAIAYNRQICLVGGQYRIHYSTLGHWTVETKLVINGTSVTRWVDNQGQQPCELSWVGTLKRGDYVQIIGANHDDSTTSDYMQYYITRL